MELFDLAFNAALWWRFGAGVHVHRLTDYSGAFVCPDAPESKRRYKTVWSGSLHLRDKNLPIWTEKRTLLFPQICNSCGQPASASVTVPAVPFLRGSTHIEGVPQCGACARKTHVSMMALSHQLGSCESTMINIICESEEFLRQTLSMNSQGDLFPPWIVFPNEGPNSSVFRQGSGEYWYDFVWGPFFEGLQKDRQQEYIDRWNPPESWREALPSE